MQLSPHVYHRLVRPRWFTRHYIHNHLERQVDFRNKRVLDFGAGTGANCQLCEPGLYDGIDPDGRRIAFAKRIYPEYRFDVLNGTELQYEDGSFDVVMVVSVLHHISSEEIRAYLQEFRRVLKPGGLVLGIEPYLHERTPISNWFMTTNDKGEYIRPEHEYVGFFTENGFACEVIKTFKKCFLYNELLFGAKVLH